MIWSKLKKSIEALLADAVKQHLQVHTTRYGPGVSAIMNRAWITWDGKEIHTFSSIQWLQARDRQVLRLHEMDEAPVYPDMLQLVEYLLSQQGIFSYHDFYIALEEYLSLSVENALESDNMLIKAWTMFDRRLGKRRLLTLDTRHLDHTLVRQWYQLRCDAEGIIAVQHLNSD